MIVGTELKQVERVTGRLTYARAAMAGAASGLWMGLFVGFLLSLFSTQRECVRHRHRRSALRQSSSAW